MSKEWTKSNNKGKRKSIICARCSDYESTESETRDEIERDNAYEITLINSNVRLSKKIQRMGRNKRVTNTGK